MNEKETRMYFQGLRDGVMKYAHWKNGEQFVGTTGRTLREAIKEINDEEERRLVKLKAYNE